MRKLWLASLGAILLLCLSVSVVFAQSDEPTVPFCGDLSESECAAIDASSAQMAALTSGTSVNQFKLYGTGGALGDREVSLILTSDNTFVIDQQTLERLNTLKAMPPDEFAADPNAIAEAALMPLDIDTAQAVTLTVSPELATSLSATFHMSVPNTLSFHTRIVNGVIYVRLADFAIFAGKPEWMPEWIGVEARTFLSNTVSTSIANSTINAADIQHALMPPGAALEGTIIYHVPAEDIAAYQDFMKLVALGAGEQNGEAVKVYYLTWDLPRYFGGALFAERMGQESYPSAESRLYGSLATILLDGLTTNMRQAIGISDSYVHSADTNVTWAVGIPGGPPIADRPTIGFSLSMHNSNLNQVKQILPPAGAIVLPINLLLGMMSGLGQ